MGLVSFMDELIAEEDKNGWNRVKRGELPWL